MLANSEDTDQTPRSAASELGLHCLHMSQKWDAIILVLLLSSQKIAYSIRNVEIGNLRLFADDTSLYIIVDDTVAAAGCLNSDLQKITRWAAT